MSEELFRKQVEWAKSKDGFDCLDLSGAILWASSRIAELEARLKLAEEVAEKGQAVCDDAHCVNLDGTEDDNLVVRCRLINELDDVVSAYRAAQKEE